MSTRIIRAASVAAVAFTLAASPVLGDECADMTKSVQELIAKVDVEKDKPSPALKCARGAEMVGLLKTLRVVVDECLSGDNRIQKLAEGDRVTRSLQSELDKTCQ